MLDTKKIIEKKTNLDNYNVKYFDHHHAHAATACCFEELHDEKEWLIFTMDAEGDSLSSTIYTFKNNELKKISQNDRNKSIGYLYSKTTEILGMKSNEHEFKVMGMAPYANNEISKKISNKIEQIVFLDKKSGQFVNRLNVKNYKNELENIYRHERFDNICGGIQTYTEIIIKDWVEFWVNKTNINNVAFSGGVFMNVKATKNLSTLEKISKVFVTPSCGDESLGFGAIYLRLKELNIKNKFIKNLYLGRKFSTTDFEKFIEKENLAKKYDLLKLSNNEINSKIADLLANQKVVGRFYGREEWGARALGNRSILCDPRRLENISKLNDKIKSRDFWMPFAPSILHEDQDLFFKNPKNISCDYMQTSFDPTDFAIKNIPAAIHPKDKTLRPQVVTKENQKEFHEILESFKKITNVGCLLNTSFNLHGNPNVGSLEDAWNTFINSGLYVLNVEDFIIMKNK